ncbi:MAG: hypothetical protein ACYCQM_11060 [Acidithiobacillus sp.]
MFILFVFVVIIIIIIVIVIVIVMAPFCHVVEPPLNPGRFSLYRDLLVYSVAFYVAYQCRNSI